MKLLINDKEFSDAVRVIVKILNEDYLLHDFYIDDNEIIHVTFKEYDGEQKH